MDASQIYILLSVAVLAVIAAVLILTGKKMRKPLSPLAGLASAFIVAGIVFGEDRWLGYGLMGAGVVLAVFDVIRKSKIKEK